MKLTGTQIAQATGGTLVRDAGAGEVLTDTRALTPGTWFLALVGERFDGHAFLDQAKAAGAHGVVVDRPVPDWAGGVVRVTDTMAAMADLGRWARAQVSVPVVGITGSSGKTTTRALVALALSPLGAIHQTVGNLNNHLGVPMTLLATPHGSDALVVEMGTSSPGEIEHLARVATPTHRLIVNVGPAHLEELGGLDGVRREKGALFDTAGPDDVLLVNVDDARLCSYQAALGQRIVRWGRGSDADIQLLDVHLDAGRLTTHLRVRGPDGEVAATLPAFGVHFALNATAALALAYAVGIDLGEAAAKLAEYEPVGMRQRMVTLPTGALVLNDAYNANPASVKAALDTLAGLGGRGIAALGDMLELGAHEQRLHAEVVGYAESLGLERLLLVGPRMALAASHAPSAHVFDHPDAAAATLVGTLGPQHRLLVKGSRGMAMERILQPLTTTPEVG
ncbi:MAG: UDP-N-acetylmuramoyl-tripeptide--D-alanyl-D-alanine ligase [Myxococcota bacterium]